VATKVQTALCTIVTSCTEPETCVVQWPATLVQDIGKLSCIPHLSSDLNSIQLFILLKRSIEYTLVSGYEAHVLTSNNTVWELVLQGDSYLCVKRADSAQTPLHWCSMTNGTKERRAIFQHDGNFCVGTGGGGGGGEGGGGGGGGDGGGAVGSWCTKTAGMIVKPGAAAMLNNGSFCIMSGWGGDGDGGEAVWCDKR
jgi:hypothetical protein